MSKFKVGDEVKVIGINSTSNAEIKIGDIRVVTDIMSSGVELDSIEYGWLHDYDVELAKPKWTIYNNTLPWADLSDKQKGKLLLADHNGKSFGGTHKTVFNNPCHPYQAKPEPTMAELFLADWGDIAGVEMDGYFNFAGKIIAKGWVKKC
jgi:hypothetical protein